MHGSTDNNKTVSRTVTTLQRTESLFSVSFCFRRRSITVSHSGLLQFPIETALFHCPFRLSSISLQDHLHWRRIAIHWCLAGSRANGYIRQEDTHYTTTSAAATDRRVWLRKLWLHCPSWRKERKRGRSRCPCHLGALMRAAKRSTIIEE